MRSAPATITWSGVASRFPPSPSAPQGTSVRKPSETRNVQSCLWVGTKPFALGPFFLEPGDVFLEHYYAREWFNILEIHDESGTFKGWYCNVTRPVTVSQDEIRWWDLALDLLILPDGRQILLDEDEFEDLRPSADLRERTAEALNTLRCWLRRGYPPFRPVRGRTGGE